MVKKCKNLKCSEMSEPRHRLPLFLKGLFDSDEICAWRDMGYGKQIVLVALYNGPHLLLQRICAIYSVIRLDDPIQDPDIFKFLSWLLETFLPFLTHCEKHLADVRSIVDSYLLGNQFPPLAQMISKLGNHFTMVPIRLFCCIFVTKMRPIQQDRYQRRIPPNQYLTAFAIARLNGTGGQASDSEARRFGLTLDQLTKILMNLSHLLQIRGKSFQRRLHVITNALNFLIKKLSDEKIEYSFHLIRRLLSGL